MKIKITEVLDGAHFYYQHSAYADEVCVLSYSMAEYSFQLYFEIYSFFEQLERLSRQINSRVPEEDPKFAPREGDVVLAHYANEWFRSGKGYEQIETLLLVSTFSSIYH